VQAERLDQQAPHQAVEALARDLFHDRADHAPAEVAIREVGARAGVRRPHLAFAVQAAAGNEDVFQRRIDAPGIAGLVAQGRGMGQQVAQGDSLVREVRITQGKTEVAGDVGVQVHFAFLGQAHQAERGHHLRDRGDAEQGVGIDRLAGQAIRAHETLAELGLVGDAAVADRQHRQAGQFAGRVRHNGSQFLVEFRLQRGRHGGRCARGAGRGRHQRIDHAQQGHAQ
jgi:hypothetical protein